VWPPGEDSLALDAMDGSCRRFILLAALFLSFSRWLWTGLLILSLLCFSAIFGAFGQSARSDGDLDCVTEDGD
jgi:hypothetical protein